MEPKESALFIGGSRGIGRAFTLEAIRRNVQAIAVARQFRIEDPAFDSAIKIVADIATREGMAILRSEKIWQVPYVFWTAGSYFRGRLALTEDRNIDRMLAMHMGLLMKFVRGFQEQRMIMRKPFTLVVMGSISSYKLRKYEAVYAAAKAGQAQFLRTFAAEMAEDLPGSRILTVNTARLGSEPGQKESDAGGKCIDPGYVAHLVWETLMQRPDGLAPYLEMNIERGTEGLIISYRPHAPETI